MSVGFEADLRPNIQAYDSQRFYVLSHPPLFLHLGKAPKAQAFVNLLIKSHLISFILNPIQARKTQPNFHLRNTINWTMKNQLKYIPPSCIKPFCFCAGHRQVVEYLVARPETCLEEQIQALELLGATFVDKRQERTTAYSLWSRAINLR